MRRATLFLAITPAFAQKPVDTLGGAIQMMDAYGNRSTVDGAL
jgi:hypothetical protein